MVRRRYQCLPAFMGALPPLLPHWAYFSRCYDSRKLVAVGVRGPGGAEFAVISNGDGELRIAPFPSPCGEEWDAPLPSL
jgi:hypothetical protein